MKIGILSDSHDQIHNIQQAVQIFNEAEVELVIHCGDWVAPFTLLYYEDLKCPIKGVFGNNDGDKFRHLERSKVYDVEIEYGERFLSFEMGGKKFAVFHGDYDEIVDALVQCGTYDVVCSGHNHQKKIERVGKTLAINPGTLMEETDPEVTGASIAIYDTELDEAEFILLP